jgi:hypothetical protein
MRGHTMAECFKYKEMIDPNFKRPPPAAGKGKPHADKKDYRGKGKGKGTDTKVRFDVNANLVHAELPEDDIHSTETPGDGFVSWGTHHTDTEVHETHALVAWAFIVNHYESDPPADSASEQVLAPPIDEDSEPESPTPSSPAYSPSSPAYSDTSEISITSVEVAPRTVQEAAVDASVTAFYAQLDDASEREGGESFETATPTAAVAIRARMVTEGNMQRPSSPWTPAPTAPVPIPSADEQRMEDHLHAHPHLNEPVASRRAWFLMAREREFEELLHTHNEVPVIPRPPHIEPEDAIALRENRARARADAIMRTMHVRALILHQAELEAHGTAFTTPTRAANPYDRNVSQRSAHATDASWTRRHTAHQYLDDPTAVNPGRTIRLFRDAPLDPPARRIHTATAPDEPARAAGAAAAAANVRQPNDDDDDDDMPALMEIPSDSDEDDYADMPDLVEMHHCYMANNGDFTEAQKLAGSLMDSGCSLNLFREGTRLAARDVPTRLVRVATATDAIAVASATGRFNDLIRQAALVPGLSIGLLSMRYFRRIGYDVRYLGNTLQMFHPNGHVIPSTFVNGLYYVAHADLDHPFPANVPGAEDQA